MGKNVLKMAIIGVLGFLLALILTSPFGSEKSTERMRVERVVKRDTVRVNTPVPIRDTVVRIAMVKMPVDHFREATKMVVDSAEVSVPITQTIYSDSTYKAWVSGYLSRLDSIEVYREKVFVTKTIERAITKPPRRWGVGVSAGAAYGVTSRQVEPYIGIGVTYVLF